MTQLTWWTGAALIPVTALYLAAIFFRMLMVCAGGTPSARTSALSPALRLSVPDEELPRYSVLVDMVRREGSGFFARNPAADPIAHLSALEYAGGRLQVLLLIGEPSDLPGPVLPAHFEVVIVGSVSRTEAYDIGLARASGELCVAYEPGHKPDLGQLRAAAAAFAGLPAWVVCIKPESRRRNPDASWLAQCSAAEDAARSVFMRGLDRFRLPMPDDCLSSHFRIDALRRVGGWRGNGVDGARIGLRIARQGWSVRTFASVTSEEGEDRLGPWFSRSAAMITQDYRSWLALVRSPLRLCRELGPVRFFAVLLTAVLPVLTGLVNPLFWLLALAWLAGGSGPVTAVFPLAALELMMTALVLANLLTGYVLMTGCMERGLFRAVRTTLLAPAYWALTSVAAYWAILPRDLAEPTRAAVPRVAAS